MNKTEIYQKYLFGVLLLGCAFWFLKGPAPRFGLGYFIPIYSISIVAIFFKEPGNKYSFIRLGWIVGISVFYCFYALDVRPFRSYRVKPPESISVAYRDTIVNGISINIPIDGISIQADSTPLCTQCWALPLPCTFLINKGLKPMGNSIQEGFYISQ